MKIKVIRFWEVLLLWLVALALIVPLLTVPHIVMGLVFIKLTVFEILVELALAVYLILWGLNPQKYRPRFSWLTIAVLIFASILILSTIFSLQPYTSFWGSAFRLNGLFAYFHYFVFFLILSWSLCDKKQWLKLLQVAIFTSLAVALYSLAQYINLPFIFESAEGRIMGTVTNPLTLAEYLLLLFFPTLVYGLRTRSNLLRWFLLPTAFLQFVIIFLTGARGAILALVAGSIIFIFCYFWLHHKRLLKWISFALCGFVILAGLSFWGLKQLPPSENYVLHRIQSIDINHPAIQNRLHIWKVAWQASQERLVLGYGLDNFEVAFQKHYQPFAERFSNAETWTDRAHNSFLDYLVMTGILGLFAYILLIAVALWRSIVIVITPRRAIWQRSTAVALIAMLGAYVVFNISAFDVISAYVIFFFLLALLNSFSWTQREDSKPTRFKWLLYLIVAVVLGIVISIQARHILANRTAGYAIATFYQKDFDKSILLFKKSLDYKTLVSFVASSKMLEAGKEFILRPEAIAQTEMLLELGELFEQNIPQPFNGKYFATLADYYGRLALLDSSVVGKMDNSFKKAVSLSPYRPFLYLNWGGTLTKLEQNQEALEKYEKAVEIYPDFPLGYFWLAVGQISLGQLAEGNESLIKATELDLDIEIPTRLMTLAVAFEEAGQYNEAALRYKQVIEKTEGQPEPYYITISFYYRVGWYKQAYDLAKSYLEQRPNDPTTLGLIEAIKQKAPYLRY